MRFRECRKASGSKRDPPPVLRWAGDFLSAAPAGNGAACFQPRCPRGRRPLLHFAGLPGVPVSKRAALSSGAFVFSGELVSLLRISAGLLPLFSCVARRFFCSLTAVSDSVVVLSRAAPAVSRVVSVAFCAVPVFPRALPVRPLALPALVSHPCAAVLFPSGTGGEISGLFFLCASAASSGPEAPPLSPRGTGKVVVRHMVSLPLGLHGGRLCAA